MRYLYSILLIGTLLLYLAGYQVMYTVLRDRLSADWHQKVESQSFDESRTMVRSIPLTLPYVPDQEDFETMIRSVEVDGEMYRVLQLRYAKDTLHVVYAKDRIGQQLHTTFRNLVNTTAQEPAKGNNTPAGKILKSISTSYLCCSFQFNFENNYNSQQQQYPQVSEGFNSPFLMVDTPPPKIG